MRAVESRPDGGPRVHRFREVGPGLGDAFVARGLPARLFFPHRSYYVPKCGPDALRLGRRMCGEPGAGSHWEVLLHADPALVDRFPPELFFDDDVIWHRQHLGMTGHLAFAYVIARGGTLYGLNYVSDLVQRISRRPELRTRIDKVFKGWPHMLLNSIVNFAVEQGIGRVCSPTAAAVMSQTDPRRIVEPALFERVYDRALSRQFSATRAGPWWVIDVDANRDRLVPPARREAVCSREKTICLCHDIERGYGHVGIDEERARTADRIAPGALAAMLAREDAAGVRATYNVVGCFFDEVRAEIERGRHCLAFHSFDHRLRRWWPVTKHYDRVRRAAASLAGRDLQGRYNDQLYRCRLVDRRVRGFRPPRSWPSPEWTDDRLVFRNFDWCATSQARLGPTAAFLENHLVKIPVHLDDFALYKERLPFAQWEERAMRAIDARAFTVLALHDCYADLWLPHYAGFLEKIMPLGTFKTLDQVADEAILSHAV